VTGLQIIGRAQWGARYPDGCGPAPVPASEVWLHHTDTLPPAADATIEQESAKIRELEDIGQTRFGCGISYTWLIPPSGRIYQGHTPPRQGAHTFGHNDAGRAIALVGQHMTIPPTGAQIASAAALLRHAVTQGWTTQARLTGGHRDAVTTTECPGDAAYRWIPAINRIAGEAGVAYALDYSGGRPGAAAVLAAGYVGVIRYVGFDPSTRPKCITKAEYQDLTANGVGVALVYEDQAGDMLGGAAAGAAAAGRAAAWANSTGFPLGRPIFFACDTDIVGQAQMDAVRDYLTACGKILGPARVGVYGEYDVLEMAAATGAAAWFWQTRAWSGGRVNARAHIRQEIGTYTVGGIACDRNTILAADWGQTGAGALQEEDMPLTDDDVLKVVNGFNTLGSAAGGDLLKDFINRIRQYLGRDLGFATAAQISNVAAQLATNAAGVAAGIKDVRSAVLGAIAALPTDHMSDEERAQLAADVAGKVDGLGAAEVEEALRHVFADAAQPDAPA
jgi:hypothetical protein